LTTVKGIVEAQEYLFENLWRNAILAQYKIKEIEEGIKPTFTEILRDPLGIQKLVFLSRGFGERRDIDAVISTYHY
jgi:two-component system, OmpR family, sensor histidine kinase VicK